MKTRYALIALSLLCFACGQDAEPEGMVEDCPPGQRLNPLDGTCVPTRMIPDAPRPTQDMTPTPVDDMTPPPPPDMGPPPDLPGCTDPITLYRDADDDGYGTNDPATNEVVCRGETRAGYVEQAGDCDDAEPRKAPDRSEICDTLDNDCNGQRNDGLTCTFFAQTETALYRIDPFAMELMELASVPGLFDMDTHPDGTLYGITSVALHRFDQGSNTWQLIGSLGTTGVTPNGLAIRSDGRAFATASDELYTVDLSTGRATLVGTMGGSFSSSGDCVVNKGDTLFMTSTTSRSDELVRIDQNTGRASLIGNTGFADIYALTSAWGTLFGLTGAGELISIDARTGEATRLHTFPNTSWYGAASTPDR